MSKWQKYTVAVLVLLILMSWGALIAYGVQHWSGFTGHLQRLFIFSVVVYPLAFIRFVIEKFRSLTVAALSYGALALLVMFFTSIH